jgi:hypothetical protein
MDCTRTWYVFVLVRVRVLVPVLVLVHVRVLVPVLLLVLVLCSLVL